MVIICPFMLDNMYEQTESHSVDAYMVDEAFMTSLGRKNNYFFPPNGSFLSDTG